MYIYLYIVYPWDPLIVLLVIFQCQPKLRTFCRNIFFREQNSRCWVGFDTQIWSFWWALPEMGTASPVLEKRHSEGNMTGWKLVVRKIGKKLTLEENACLWDPVYQLIDTVDGKYPALVEVSSLSRYLRSFIHPRWVFSQDFWTINSMVTFISPCFFFKVSKAQLDSENFGKESYTVGRVFLSFWRGCFFFRNPRGTQGFPDFQRNLWSFAKVRLEQEFLGIQAA